jgi:hypothetical protein
MKLLSLWTILLLGTVEAVDTNAAGRLGKKLLSNGGTQAVYIGMKGLAEVGRVASTYGAPVVEGAKGIAVETVPKYSKAV